ncbi:MAG: methyltransferase domain-containing protein [Patescibacteria group bacterium]
MSTFDKETKRNEFFEWRDREIDALIDPATGKISADLTEHIVCRLCDNPAYDILFTKNGFDFVRCKNCALVYVNPQMKADAMVAYYNSDVASNDRALDFLSSPKQREVDKELYDALFDEIKPRIPSGRILDVGCSYGLFLKTAKEAGYDVHGLELNEKAAAHAEREFGIPVERKLLEDAHFPENHFDIVTMFGVVEHLIRPVEVLREVARILKPGGLFVGRCPNVYGLVCGILHAAARTFTGRVHVSYFSEPTLRLLFEKAGFQKADIKTFVSGRDSILNHLQFSDPFGDETTEFLPEKFRTFLASPENVQSLEQMLAAFGLGYKFKFIVEK